MRYVPMLEERVEPANFAQLRALEYLSDTFPEEDTAGSRLNACHSALDDTVLGAGTRYYHHDRKGQSKHQHENQAKQNHGSGAGPTPPPKLPADSWRTAHPRPAVSPRTWEQFPSP